MRKPPAGFRDPPRTKELPHGARATPATCLGVWALRQAHPSVSTTRPTPANRLPSISPHPHDSMPRSTTIRHSMQVLCLVAQAPVSLWGLRQTRRGSFQSRRLSSTKQMQNRPAESPSVLQAAPVPRASPQPPPTRIRWHRPATHLPSQTDIPCSPSWNDSESADRCCSKISPSCKQRKA